MMCSAMTSRMRLTSSSGIPINGRDGMPGWITFLRTMPAKARARLFFGKIVYALPLGP